MVVAEFGAGPLHLGQSVRPVTQVEDRGTVDGLQRVPQRRRRGHPRGQRVGGETLGIGGRGPVTTAKPEAVTSHQTSGMPDEVAKVLQDLTAEYEDTETIESRVAHDADKIETLIQAREYGAQGYATGPWEDTSIQALRTESGKQLAQAITAGDPARLVVNVRGDLPRATSQHPGKAKVSDEYLRATLTT